MASKELRFDVSALDQASRTFTRMGQAVERFEKRLDRLDGKRVEAELGVKTDKAEREVGAFATTTRRRLQAALSSLPEIEIDANSTPAQREVARIRDEMASLADKRIGIDISADEAIREAQRLERELDELSRTSTEVDVRANTGEAARHLREFKRDVDDLDGRRVVVHVRTDRSLLDSTSHLLKAAAAMRAFALPSAIISGAPALVSLGGAAASAAGSLLLLPAAGNAAGLAIGTLITAFQGFGDALGDDPEKAAEALAKMAPAARESAEALRGMKPALTGIRESVQQAFFDGLGERIGQLGSNYLPIVERATTRVAGQFNAAGDSLLQFLNHGDTVKLVDGMFTDLGTTVGNLAPTITPLTSVMNDVGAVGAKVLADITGGAEGAATSFARMVSNARESGAMEAAIRRGLTEMQRFGQVAGNVGGILSGMYRAGKASGNDFLGTLVDLTGRMDDFVNSAEGQADIVGIFTGLNEAADALAPGLDAVGQALGQIVTNRSTSGALTDMAGAFSDLLVAAAPTAVAFSRLVTVGLGPFSAAVSFAAPLIGPLVGGLLAMKAATSGINFLLAATGLKTLGSAALTATGQMRGVATAATNVGTTAGTAAAGTGRVATALGKVQSVAGSVGRSLPLVGLAFIAADTAVQAMTVSLDEAMAAYSQGGAAADAMREKVDAQTLSNTQGADALEQWGNGILDWTRSTLFGVATTEDYNAAIEEQNRLMAESVSATGISRSAFDQITGSMDRSKKASQQVTDSLALIGPAMAGIKDGVAPTKEMDTALKGVADEARNASQAAGESATKLGGVGAGAKAAADSMQASRDAFIQTATAAGMSEEAAGKLADKLGLIPKTARTDFETNAATTAIEIGQVKEKLDDVPVGKSITMNAVTETAQTALQTLGLEVRTLPDGRVEVTAPTEAARASLDSFVRGIGDQRAEITIDGLIQPAQSALSSVLAAIAAGRETVNIDGNDRPARDVLAHLLGMVQGENATVEIRGKAEQAEQVVEALIQAIETKSPMVDIGGNKVPFDEVLASLNGGAPIQKDIEGNPLRCCLRCPGCRLRSGTTRPRCRSWSATTRCRAGSWATSSLPPGPRRSSRSPRPERAAPVLAGNQALAGGALAGQPIGPGANGVPDAVWGNVATAAGAVALQPIDGNTALFQGQVLNGVAFAGGQTGTITIDGNPTTANGKTTAAVQFADGSRGSITIDGRPDPATGKINGVVSYANGSTGTITLNPRDLVSSVIARLMQPTSSTHTITVREFRSVVPISTPFKASGDYTTPGVTAYAGGGMRPMSAYRATIVPPRQLRVIGDRQTGDEAFIPVNKSPRSVSILKQTAEGMDHVALRKDELLGIMSRVMPMANGGMVTAARHILDRMRSGGQLFEDWTWKGAPGVVGQYNDALHNARKAAGYSYGRGRAFLEDYIRRNTTAAVPTAAAMRSQVQAAQAARVQAAQVNAARGAAATSVQIPQIGQLVSVMTSVDQQLRQLRGDIAGAARAGLRSPDVVEALGALAAALPRSTATRRSASARDIGQIGDW
ncbi:hypothetical protein [Pseudonocardia alni]|uniref:hypothetical protein n=1 Tax=Pseudonocardia alni TaxID=33907 RepID=UPI0027A1528A|nr:hypothetical protein PaSha_14035 [Pseudonocardia alni]